MIAAWWLLLLVPAIIVAFFAGHYAGWNAGYDEGVEWGQHLAEIREIRRRVGQ